MCAYLLLSETSGAISRGLDKYLKSLAKLSKSEESQDSTIYGEGRASPKTFYPHWLAALSCAIVYQDALTLRNCASADAFMLSHGARGSLHREM